MKIRSSSFKSPLLLSSSWLPITLFKGSFHGLVYLFLSHYFGLAVSAFTSIFLTVWVQSHSLATFAHFATRCYNRGDNIH